MCDEAEWEKTTLWGELFFTNPPLVRFTALEKFGAEDDVRESVRQTGNARGRQFPLLKIRVTANGSCNLRIIFVLLQGEAPILHKPQFNTQLNDVFHCKNPSSGVELDIFTDFIYAVRL